MKTKWRKIIDFTTKKNFPDWKKFNKITEKLIDEMLTFPIIPLIFITFYNFREETNITVLLAFTSSYRFIASLLFICILQTTLIF